MKHIDKFLFFPILYCLLAPFSAFALTNQTIITSLTTPANAQYGATFLVSAASDSGLPVQITVSGGCSLNGDLVTVTSSSIPCTVHYDQAGDATYAPATQVSESIVTEKKSLIIKAKSDTKFFDGSNTSSLIPEIVGILAQGDTPSFSQVYDNPDIGTNKIIIPSGVVLDGNNGNNYDYTFVNNNTGIINPMPVTGSGPVLTSTDTNEVSKTVVENDKNETLIEEENKVELETEKIVSEDVVLKTSEKKNKEILNGGLNKVSKSDFPIEIKEPEISALMASASASGISISIYVMFGAIVILIVAYLSYRFYFSKKINKK